MYTHTITMNHTGPFLKRNQTIYTAADGFLQKEFGMHTSNKLFVHLTGKGFKYSIWKEQNLKSKNNFE